MAARLRAAALGLPGRVAVTAVLVALLVTLIDWDVAVGHVRDGEPLWLLAAVLALDVALLAGTWRWAQLLRSARVPAAGRTVLRGYFAGAFANNFLPTGFGGDAVRALVVARRGPELTRAATTVVVDRLTALGCLVALGWLVVPFAAASVPSSLLVGLLIVSAAGIAGVALLWFMSSVRAVRALLPARLAPFAAEVWGPLRALAADPSLLVRVAVLGLVYQALLMLSVWCGAQAVNVDVPYALLAVTVPLVLILTLVPISLAGFGVREGGFVVLLGAGGVGPTEATLVSLMTVVTLALASLPGAVFLLRGRAGSPLIARSPDDPPEAAPGGSGASA